MLPGALSALIILTSNANRPLFGAPQDQELAASAREDVPGPGEVVVRAIWQEGQGKIYKLRGAAQLETTEVLLTADYMEYHEDTGDAFAEGHVRYRNFVSGETLEADRVEYNVREETGRFYNVSGTASVEVKPRPNLLTSENPFQFEGEWAERLKDRYILHNGFLTNCHLPHPEWILKGKKFDIIPGDRAIVHHSTFRVRGIPVLYAPAFYKSLEERPRRSGLLSPTIGNSSRRGLMVGTGYFWAINRSYDAMYRTQYFSKRGFAHHVNLRGKPTQRSEFDGYFYGVDDRGRIANNGNRVVAKGILIAVTGSADLGKGFKSRWNINYLSSFRFRQEFTESFNEAVGSEVHSVGFVNKNWSSYGLDFVFERTENFNSALEDDKVTIRQLPSVEFNMRDREISRKVLPIWVSFDSAFGLLRRNQPLFQTRRFVDRVDLAPRITTALRIKDIHITPSASVRATQWGSNWLDDEISGGNLVRTSGEFDVNVQLPSLARIYNGPRWLGEKVKHVIETRAGYRYVTGISDFDRIILFDETELLSDTNEVDYSITNRIYVKRNGVTQEALSWEVWQARYFDPYFGGAVVEGERNALLSSLRLTGYAFIDGPRHYSPIVSNLRVSPRPGVGISWRTDYDPLLGRLTNTGFGADARFGKYSFNLSHNRINTAEALTPPANQVRGLFAVGARNKRGWNAAFMVNYDFRRDRLLYATTQATYNSDCCGVSFQFRRFSFGTRLENQFRVSFSLANIGSFGTLPPQERIF